jgi:GLPGLI family protein
MSLNIVKKHTCTKKNQTIMFRIICLPLLAMNTLYSKAQELIRLNGKINYEVYSGKTATKTHIQNYYMYFNDQVIQYKVNTPGTEELVKNQVIETIRASTPNIDSVELNIETNRLLTEMERSVSKGYFFLKNNTTGFDFTKNGKKYFGLDSVRPNDSVKIELSNDTATILGFKCQKYILTTSKNVLYYWNTLTIPISVDPLGTNRFPGITLQLENQQGTIVYKAVALEYPSKDVVTFEYDKGRVVSQKEALKLQKEMYQEVDVDSKKTKNSEQY